MQNIVEFRCWGKIDDVLHLPHHRNLIGSIGQIDALALRAHMIAIEIGGALFELGEILNGAQRSFRSMNALVETSPQAYRLIPTPRAPRPVSLRLLYLP